MNREMALELTHISAAYTTDLILHDVSFSIPKGVRCAIMGPNGAGKTTLLQCALGLHRPLVGSVSFFGKPFSEVRSQVAYVPQRKGVDWQFPITVHDVVLMGTYHSVPFYKKLPVEAYIKTHTALKQMDMLDYADKPINELSGGQQQRVFIARALVQNAHIYLMDEPFAGIDQTTERAIENAFHALQKKGCTLCVVHHDWKTVKLYFDWIVLINKELIYCGPLNISLIDYYFEQAFSELKI